ncbi:MAG: AAA family ATPase [Anaerolineae bacterium]|nr:AAA family ATPase [Anaerolineae bacterium]
MQGYKSFATRTEFVFPSGITAIVGPNGSGKSNVADAVRWALGEQSLRSMRGKRTTDLIFSGSKRRARAGMAEVVLTLDNSAGLLPVEFVEVSVGRRAYRSGETEYLLNGARVRLRDVSQLLAESGLSERTYAVIGQGLIDTALSLRPQERRALFEEAAGIAVYRSQREEAAGRLEETAHNLERVRDILSEIAPRLERLQKQVEQFHEYERISAHLLRLQRVWYGYHWGQAQEALHAADERVRALEGRLADRRNALDIVSRDLAKLRQRQTDLRTVLRDAYHRTAELHDRADAAQREFATLTERVRLQTAQREEMLQELAPLQAQVDAQRERVQAAEAELAASQAKAQVHESHLAELEETLRALRARAQECAARRKQTRREIDALQARRAELEKAVAAAQAAQVRLEAEYEVLARLREETDAFHQGVRSILEAGLAGVVGVVGALLRVPEAWELAVEAALGERVQALVVQDWSVVAAVKGRLAQDQRAVLLPLATLRPAVGVAAPLPPGVTRAADVVTCDAPFEPVAEALLGSTWLVEDLAAARAAQPHLPPGGRCVTRAGEVAASDGTVVVGVRGAGVLAQERTWRELPRRLEAARQRQAESEGELARAAERAAALAAALETAEREFEAANQAVTQAEGGPLAEARTRVAVARQALDTQRGLLRRERADLERVEAQMQTRRQRVDALAGERKSAERRLEQLRYQTDRFEAELEEARAHIGPAEEQLSSLTEERERADKQERQARDRVRAVEDQLGKARLGATRHRDRLVQLQERIKEDLGLVDLEVVTEDVSAQRPLPLQQYVSPLPVVEQLPEGLEEEIYHLKARLRQIGPINPGATQEYEDTRERHAFLAEQVADLEATSAQLRAVIAELDAMMELAFKETFEAIAVAFEDIFARLFKGGSARLELTDPEDVMATGVDIVARPPGKRLQSLALLSGGERALSAAALIFAILRVRPTPLCVLDEVDAMLDETNVARFREMLAEMSAQTQFIIITHNRHTIEVADIVYGISMGADGVSQMVSLRVTEEEG